MVKGGSAKSRLSKVVLGAPWWPSGEDSGLFTDVARVQSLVREMRPCKPRGVANERKGEK